MGTDFICFIIGMPIGQEPNWNISEGQYEAAARTFLRECGREGEPLGPIIKDLKQSVTEVKDAWNNGGRDVVVFERGHEKVLITGGPSWGDDPTHLFTHISNLYYSGLTEVIGFDQHLDDGFMERLDLVLKRIEKKGMKKEAKEIRKIFHQVEAEMLFR